METHLILDLLLVLAVAFGAGRLADWMGYPAVLGELLAGIVLGPPLLGLLAGSEALYVLAEVGILLLMLYIGMEIHPSDLTRASKGGVLAALGGFVVPFGLCYAAIVMAGYPVLAGVFVGLAAGVTSLATKSRILVDLNLLGTRLAHTLMAGALVADVLSLVLFAALLGVGEAGGLDLQELGLTALGAIGFFAVAILFGRLVLPLLVGVLRKSSRMVALTVVLLVMLLFAEGAEMVGLHGILGAFLAGLSLRDTALGFQHAREVQHLVRDVALGFLAPVFFVTAGFAVTLDVFSGDLLGLLLWVIVLATIGKVIGTAVFYLATGHGWREGLVLGAGMNGRGAVEIILAQVGLQMGLITQDIFSILVVMAIATTATVPISLKLGVDWLRRRGELATGGASRMGVVFVGAGPMARRLAGLVKRSEPVTLVDRNRTHVAAAREAGLAVVEGNALEVEVLEEAGAGHVRTLVAMTPNAEVNALVARLAKQTFSVPEVHVAVAPDARGYDEVQQHTGATTLFGLRTPLADWDHDAHHDRLEETRLAVPRRMSAGAFVREVQAEGAALPLAVRREGAYRLFHSGIQLEEGDRVALVHPVGAELQLDRDRFATFVAEAPVLDLDEPLTAHDLFQQAARAMAPLLGEHPAGLAAHYEEAEAARSTVVLPALAIPHVRLPGSGRFALCLVRAREGVVFPDQHEPVRVAFVLATSADERTFHLRALAAIAQAVQTPGFEAAWEEAPDADALREVVLRRLRPRAPLLVDDAPPIPHLAPPEPQGDGAADDEEALRA